MRSPQNIIPQTDKNDKVTKGIIRGSFAYMAKPMLHTLSILHGQTGKYPFCANLFIFVCILFNLHWLAEGAWE
jgi:hypothetical protein